MNGARESHSSWSQAEAFDPMVALPDDDFAKFLDLEEIDLDLPPFTAEDTEDGRNSRNQQRDQRDNMNGGAYLLSPGHQHLNSKTHGREQSTDMDRQQNGSNDIRYSDDSRYSQSTPQYQLYQEPGFNAQMGIPPTPNSVEMHPDAVRYFQQLYIQQGSGMNDQQYQSGKNGMVNFTPLISPEVPASGSPYSFTPEFTVPGAYLSPLTSPALGPQGYRAPFQGARTANSSVAASPVDGSLGDYKDLSNSEERPRKTRKKAAIPRSTGPTPRQPSLAKGRRRRGTLSTDIPAKDVNSIFNEMQEQSVSRTQPSSAHHSAAPSRSTSVFNTASPELMPETSMAPPPKPNSVTASPAILPHTRSKATSRSSRSTDVYPATPASLMRLAQQQKSGGQNDTMAMVDESTSGYNNLESGLDDLILPEAAAATKSATAIDDQNDGSPLTGTLASAGASSITPNLHALSTHSGPMLSTITSPVTDAHKPDLSRSSSKGSRRRNGGGSVLISPALRPKISPSIKPLLPEGASSMSSETHALLLASKSNYQNILEGTHPPGVTYPSELSTNLTSKRTSHKLAEQGRRNRINTALQTMQELLPAPVSDGAGSPVVRTNGSPPIGSEESQTESKTPLMSAQQQGNSKAATVEQAIDYIKALTGRLESQDREIEGLKARLQKAQGQNGPAV